MTRRSRIDQIIRLTQCGWRAYEGQATTAVYDHLDCGPRNRGLARWFARGDLLVCIGCERACLLPCPTGFQLPLFKYPAPPRPVFRLTPEELLAKRKLLTVNETAYVLNVSPRHVRDLIRLGRLLVTRSLPQRVPVEEVKKEAKDVGLWMPEGEAALDDRAGSLGHD